MDVLKVFISGTQIDLGPERKAVERAVHSIKWEAVRAETYGSQPMPSRAACQEMVERSDIYLGLYGGRYGWVIPGDDLSVTEFEFNEARRLGKPMLVYVKDVPPEQIEPREAAFLKRVEDFDTGFFRRPRFTSTQDLGEWVKADLAQLVKRLLAERAARRVPFMAPPDLDVWVGRQPELDALRQHLTQGKTVAVLGLIGLGGLGKTALAIHAAHALRDRFPDGVLWARLDRQTPADIVATFGREYGLDLSGYPDLAGKAAALRQALATKRALIVLDGARLEDDATIGLLVPGGCCAVLVTSRRRDLATLRHAARLELPRLSVNEALDLLRQVIGVERVGADLASAQRIAEVCGYLPLALDIAASRLRDHPDWPLGEMRARLADAHRRLDELKLSEDYGVRTSFALSYDLLPDYQQRFFACLGVIGGVDFAARAAAAVANVGEAEAAAWLEDLRRLSLVQDGRPGRATLHPLLRDYAGDELRRKWADEDGAFLRMARHYCDVTQEGDAYLAGVQDERGELHIETEKGLALLDLELSNLRAGQKWAAAHRAWEMARDYILASARYFDLHADWDSWIVWSEAGLRACATLADEGSGAAILGNLGLVYRRKGEWERAIEFHQKALAILEKLGDVRGLAAIYGNLGLAYADQGEWQRAIEFYQQSLAILEKLGDVPGLAQTYNSLGEVWRMKGAWERASEFYQQSLAIKEKLGDVHGLAQTYCNLGLVYADQGEWQRAIEFYQQSLAILEKLGDVHGLAQTYNNLGSVYVRKGEWERASEFYQKDLAISEKLGDVRGLAQTYNNLGSVYAGKGEWERAIEFHQKALTILEKLGDVRGLAAIYGNLGLVYADKGEWQQAIEFSQKDLAISEKLGDVHGLAQAYLNLGSVYLQKGEWERASEFYQQSLAIFEKLGDMHGMALAYTGLGYLYEARGDFKGALEYASRALDILHRLGAFEEQQVAELVARLKERLAAGNYGEAAEN